MIEIDPVEQKILLEAIFLKHGYDFRQYAEASLSRRLESLLSKFNIQDPLVLLQYILRDPSFFSSILPRLTVSTTEPFRDPPFFKALRLKVIPVLRTYPSLKIWLAGCSTGEEVYSVAILLKEEGIYERSTIYATDIDPIALKMARDGIYGFDSMQTFAKNYAESGGLFSPSDYYTAEYGKACFDSSLRDNVVFSEHNLVTDSVFTEANLILCRNVLIYFSKPLQERVFDLFTQSLVHRGFLALGSKENLRFSRAAADFEVLEKNWKIYQKATRIVAPSSQGHPL